MTIPAGTLGTVLEGPGSEVLVESDGWVRVTVGMAFWATEVGVVAVVTELLMATLAGLCLLPKRANANPARPTTAKMAAATTANLRRPDRHGPPGGGTVEKPE
jgi:hypothetical protein